MGQIRTFRDLLVWQKAHELVLLVYKITKSFPRTEQFGLISQVCRAIVSVAANIVEGFRRRTLKDSLNFYYTAAASLEEVKYYFILAKDLGYVTASTFQQLNILAEEVGRLLSRWIQSQPIHHSSVHRDF